MGTPRDDLILDHVGLYWVTTRAVLTRLFFPSGNPGNVLQRLRTEGFLRERPLGAGLHYYQLTRDGARYRVPLKRAAPLGERALEKHLGVLHFACATDVARRRIENVELVRFFGARGPLSPQVPHCLDDVADSRRIHRLYVPSARTKPATLLGSVRADVAEALAAPGHLPDYVRGRTYVFSILVDTAPWAQILESTIKRLGVRQEAAVNVYQVSRGPQLSKRQHAATTTA